MINNGEYKMLRFVNGEEAENSGLVAVVHDMNSDQKKIFHNFLIFGFEENEMTCIARTDAIQLVEVVEKIHAVLEDVLEKSSPAIKATILARLFMKKAIELAREEMQKEGEAKSKRGE